MFVVNVIIFRIAEDVIGQWVPIDGDGTGGGGDRRLNVLHNSLSGVMQQMNHLVENIDRNSAESRQFCFARDCREATVLP